MQRFPVRLHVDDLAKSIGFYSRLFAADPARSEERWVADPRSIAWEHFHTLGNIPVFNQATAAAGAWAIESSSACG